MTTWFPDVEKIKKAIKEALGITGNENLSVNVAEDSVGLAKESTLQGIKEQTDKLQFDNGNLQVVINADAIGLAKDTTVQGIKTQTDKLAFDSNNNLQVSVSNRADGVVQVASGDISGGAEADLPPAVKYTLYLHADGAIDVDIYMSPDGTNWFKIPESPVSFTEADDQVIEVGYTGRKIRLTGSNSTPVTAILHWVR